MLKLIDMLLPVVVAAAVVVVMVEVVVVVVVFVVVVVVLAAAAARVVFHDIYWLFLHKIFYLMAPHGYNRCFAMFFWSVLHDHFNIGFSWSLLFNNWHV